MAGKRSSVDVIIASTSESAIALLQEEASSLAIMARFEAAGFVRNGCVGASPMRLCRGFSSLSSEVAGLLAGIPPIDLLATARKRSFQELHGREGRRNRRRRQRDAAVEDDVKRAWIRRLETTDVGQPGGGLAVALLGMLCPSGILSSGYRSLRHGVSLPFCPHRSREESRLLVLRPRSGQCEPPVPRVPKVDSRPRGVAKAPVPDRGRGRSRGLVLEQRPAEDRFGPRGLDAFSDFCEAVLSVKEETERQRERAGLKGRSKRRRRRGRPPDWEADSEPETGAKSPRLVTVSGRIHARSLGLGRTTQLAALINLGLIDSDGNVAENYQDPLRAAASKVMALTLVSELTEGLECKVKIVEEEEEDLGVELTKDCNSLNQGILNLCIIEKKTFTDKDFWYYKNKTLISVVQLDYMGQLVFETAHKKVKPFKIYNLSTAHMCLSQLAWLYKVRLRNVEFNGNTCEYFRDIALISFDSFALKEICAITPYNKFIRLWDLRDYNGDFIFRSIA
ncbi:hypothetical protein RUM43_015067 [Polyplax serrata]|uniref:Uncharacterized protein n=1 Tax=Polyplax serrata TaxID=468196 RepID=A0AAN8NXN8_POLSC